MNTPTRKWNYRNADGVESWIEQRGEVIAVAQSADGRVRMAFSAASLRSNKLPDETVEDCALRIARAAVMRAI